MYVGNVSLVMYAKSGTVGDAVKVFEDLSEPNEALFAALMAGLVEADRFEEAFHMFKLMHRNGIGIDSVLFVAFWVFVLKVEVGILEKLMVIIGTTYCTGETNS